jgi:uncharacterized protein
MKKILLALIMVFAASAYSFAQSNNDPAYEAALKRMMKANGSDETFVVVIDQMIEMYKVQMPEISGEKWDKMGELLRSQSIETLVEMLVPVYQKHLTIEDLESIIGFYNSPAGKKLGKATPFITQESMQVGQAWGQSLAGDIAKAIEKIAE